jgi:hypothetical protein
LKQTSEHREARGHELTFSRPGDVVLLMRLTTMSLPSRPIRLLLAILVSALAIVLSILPANPIRTGWRTLVAAIIFVAYAAYVELSRNNRGRPQITLSEMVLLGAISGGTIAVLIRFEVYSALVGSGIGAALGVFADRG